MIQLVDSHAHLDLPQFDADRDAVVERARTAGVGLILTLGVDGDAAGAVALAQRTRKCMPQWAFIHTRRNMPRRRPIRPWSGWPASVVQSNIAWGEIGLDYHFNHSQPEIQRREFRRQIRLARELDLPVCIHSREAHEDVVTILVEERATDVGVVMHCFSGDEELARRCLDLGFYISFAGPITFTNARQLLAVAPIIPAEQLLIETDAPYLSPHPWRGREYRNEPARVAIIAARLAELRHSSVEEVVETTRENFSRLFNLPSGR